MHNDEAVNAVKYGSLREANDYKYDPNEYHGPTLAYGTLAYLTAMGKPGFFETTESQLRTVTVWAGLGLILFLPLVWDGLGRKGMFWAGLLTAVSPAMVFYSRYYIHEMLLVFFTFLAMGAAWRYARSPKIGWALLAGVAVGLMAATKETFVFALVAGGGALCVCWACRNWMDGERDAGFFSNFKLSHITVALGAFLVVVVLLFSSFFSNPAGLIDAVKAYLPWLHRAGGASPHIHPWNFYLERLLFFHDKRGALWSEGVIFILAAAGGVAAFSRREVPGMNRHFARFLVFYSFFLTLIYCAVPYKTPWCMLGFLHGWILLAGVGVSALGFWARPKWPGRLLLTLVVIGAGCLAAQAWLANMAFSGKFLDRLPVKTEAWLANTTFDNPYAYSLTHPNFMDMIDKIAALETVSPDGKKMGIKVMAPDSDYWPLPWYLRSFPNADYTNRITAGPYAPVIVASESMNAGLEEKLKAKLYQEAGLYQQRSGVFMELYVEKSLWKSYLEKKESVKESMEESF